MKNTREIRSRMAAVLKIGQVTRAMKLVSAAKYRKAVAILNEARPYARALQGAAGRLAGTGVDHPLLRPARGRRLLLLVIASDRGLCGAFNGNILRAARAHAAAAAPGGEVAFAAVGRKADDAFRQAGLRTVWTCAHVAARQFEATALDLADRLLAAFLEGRADEVVLIHGGFESALVQRVRKTRLLPVPARAPADAAWPARAPELVEPDAPAVAAYLLPRHVRAQVRWALLEADTAEQAARMIVMEQASRNADELVDQLRLEWNKARQDGITSELADITTGAEAVR